MDSPFALALALAAGAAVGAVFFTGLWLTVRFLPSAGSPVLLMIGSAVLRLGIALPALGFIAAGSLPRLGLAILGFLAMRTLLIQRWKPTEEP
jgi:F1F0 ATPase subunit 2